MICKIVGHETVGTYVITEERGFAEVEDAKYCTRCGTVNPEERGRVANYISSLL